MGRKRDRIGLLTNDNTLENSHCYMDNVVLYALNSQTPYRSNFGRGLWVSELERTGRAGHPSECVSSTWKIIHKKKKERFGMDYI
tara:strand:+ start:273 stop:527 length:255 start_codon:yes stop_codon:yes gene_type:complete